MRGARASGARRRSGAQLFEAFNRRPQGHAETLVLLVDDVGEGQINRRELGGFLRAVADTDRISVIINAGVGEVTVDVVSA